MIKKLNRLVGKEANGPTRIDLSKKKQTSQKISRLVKKERRRQVKKGADLSKKIRLVKKKKQTCQKNKQTVPLLFSSETKRTFFSIFPLVFVLLTLHMCSW
jgi:hypothetical protein